MKCLLLGGGGFLGSHLSGDLVDKGHSVRIFEKNGTSKKNIARPNDVEWFEGDFVNPEHLQDALDGVDVVFHLVSTTHPKTSNDDMVYDMKTNVIPTLNLLEASRKVKLKKLIFYSSGGTVYGIPRNIPISEGHPTDPICSYGIQKLTIEKYLQLYHHLFGLDYNVLRISNPYGEGQIPIKNQGAVAVFTYKALNREPIEIWGDGSVVRDYLHVSDVSRAAVSLLDYQGKYKVFNIGSGVGLSLVDIINNIKGLLGYPVEVIFMPARTLDVPENVLDISRATNDLLWTPKINLTMGLQRTISWLSSYIKNSS